MKKENVTYILKHIPTGYFLRSTGSEITLTDTISRAVKLEPNDKTTDTLWKKFAEKDDYTLIKRTEVTTVEYEEVKLDDI